MSVYLSLHSACIQYTLYDLCQCDRPCMAKLVNANQERFPAKTKNKHRSENIETEIFWYVYSGRPHEAIDLFLRGSKIQWIRCLIHSNYLVNQSTISNLHILCTIHCICWDNNSLKRLPTSGVQEFRAFFSCCYRMASPPLQLKTIEILSSWECLSPCSTLVLVS